MQEKSPFYPFEKLDECITAILRDDPCFPQLVRDLKEHSGIYPPRLTIGVRLDEPGIFVPDPKWLELLKTETCAEIQEVLRPLLRQGGLFLEITDLEASAHERLESYEKLDAFRAHRRMRTSQGHP